MKSNDTAQESLYPVKKKRIKMIVAVCVLLAVGILIRNFMTDYAHVIKSNWGIALPFFARCSEIYQIDSGTSFHGDGIRYHVYSYKYEDYIDLMFAWADTEYKTNFHMSYSDAAEAWLNAIEVPDEWRPAYEYCLYHYSTKADNSELILFWNPEENRLYIVESSL